MNTDIVVWGTMANDIDNIEFVKVVDNVGLIRTYTFNYGRYIVEVDVLKKNNHMACYLWFNGKIVCSCFCDVAKRLGTLLLKKYWKDLKNGTNLVI